ncbi:MAG: hypothetical protein ACK52S_21825 [Pirellula sp.]
MRSSIGLVAIAGNRIVHIKRRWTSDFAILQTADEALEHFGNLFELQFELSMLCFIDQAAAMRKLK